MFAGERIGPFEIEKELGSGAMGTVYRARYKETGQAVALKVIAFGLSGNDTALARFESEATILKKLRHPNIVRLFATGRYRGTPFFAMEYVEGPSLDKIMARRGRYTWEEVVQIGKQLCAALQHAHEKGIIHRDLKPSNLMILKDGTVKLTDFGIAKDPELTALTGPNSTIGTAAYMSPEQCKGEKNLTAKSDLYSMGVVFYELLTGRKPFVAESPVDMFLAHVNSDFERPGKIVLDVPVWLDTLVCQLMEKKPEHRPRDAAMVARSLDEIMQKVTAQKSAGVEAATARVVDRPRLPNSSLDETDREAGRTLRASVKKKKLKAKAVPFYQRWWFQLAAGVGGLLGILALVWFLLRPDSPETMYAAIEKAPNPEAADRAIDNYLKVYGSRTDERTQRVKERARLRKVQIREHQLANRFRKKMAPEEDDDPEAYKTTFAALGAEAEGDLKSAAEQWKALAEKYPDGSPLELWGWLGAKRLRDLEEVRKQEAGLADRWNRDRLGEELPPLDELGKRAQDAYRLEQFGDPTLARQRWNKMKEDLAKEEDKRPWFLLAAKKARDLAAQTKPKAEERADLVKAKLDEAKAYLAQVEQLSGADARLKRRDARNLLRDVRDLYANEPEPLPKLSQEAEELIAKIPKE